MAKEQRAVFITETGKPVSLGKRPIPSCGDDEVLVKITATMLLPHDAYGRDWGLFYGEKLPFVPGSNTVGEIIEVGSAITNFKKGDHVFGIGNLFAPLPDQQGLQEYATLASVAIAKVPEGFSDDQVATLPVNLLTSFTALFTSHHGFGWPVPWEDTSALKDKTVVIIGGGAVTGKYGIQLAKLAGIGTIVTIAGAKNAEELKAMGATHVIDRHGSVEEVTKQVHAVVGEEGATHVYDCGNMTFELATAILPKNKESRLIHLLPNEQLDLLKQQRPLNSSIMVDDIAEDKSVFWEHVPQWLLKGQVKPGPYRVVEGLENVDEINKALDAYIANTGGPQLIVHP